MKKLTLMLMCLLVSAWSVSAQTHLIGTVVSAEDGEPVIGASVSVKGTHIGSITDLDGKFSISAPASTKTLVVSYVGMETKEVPAKGDHMRIVLKSLSHEIEEVVVTAMGVSRDKKALGYASQGLKSESLTQAASSNIATSLQGKVSGLEIKSTSGMPGASQQITIRGARSFTGDNTPLYVVVP